MTNRTIANICASDLVLSARFYTRLLDVKVAFDSESYVLFNLKETPELEFAVIKRDHDLVPAAYRTPPTEIHTFVVKNVDSLYNRAVASGVKIVQAPRNDFDGQRRFLVKDPDGCLIDISSPIKAERSKQVH